MPIVTGVLPEGTLIVDETTLNLDATLSFAGAFNTLFGADGPGAGTIIESNRIDLYLLQDLSGSFGDDESNVSSAIANLITRIGGDLPTDTQLGAGSFVDKGDYVFQNAVNLTTDYASVQTAVNGFNASGGGDLPESQLEALLFVAQNAASLGFRPDAARTVLIATDAVAHLNGDSGLPANDADGVLENEDYPSVAQLQAALIAANIVPIFAVTADVQAFYDQLVLDLGFGSVVVLTANSSNLVDAIIDGLETTTTIGGGAVDYDLGLSANGVDSGLVHTATNHSVFLFLEGGEIVGREGTDAIDAAGNTIVFVLSVDDAGLVTLDQRAAVRHDPDTGPDQAVSIAAGLITLTGTATDGDGDSASHTLQIGATLVFEDDGPTLVASAVGAVDEDDLVAEVVGTSAFQGNSDTTSPGDDVADGASVGAGGSFGVNFGADGAAAVGAISNLTVTAAGGLGPVALTSQGDSVSVVADGANAWKGVADGRDVFTLSFNVTTGNYTFTLLDNLDHPIGDNPATALNESTEDNLVLTFGFRATDGDGDFVDTTITVNVDDDMPIVTGVLPEGTLIVDETTLNLDATLSFAGAFNTLFGADGPGAGTIIESNRIDLYLLQDLSGSFGDDESNVSSAIANLITRIGGDLPTDTQLGAGSFVDKGDYVFQNAVNLTTDYASVQTAVNGFNASGGGDLPESQLEALLFVAQNAASLGFRPDAARTVLIATDAVAHLNGDSGLPANDADGVLENEDYPSVAQLQAALIAANIVPIFAVTADVQAFYDQLVLDLGFGSVVVLTANSSNLVDAIIDGLETTTTIGGGAVDYDLGLSANGVDSGLVHTATNHSVFLFLEGGEIVGREGTDAIDAAGNTIVFVLSVDDAGLVTLDQRAAVRHDPDTGPDQAVSIAAGLITLTGTATDGDGDSASHTLQIGATLVFEDDGPTLVASAVGAVDEDDLVAEVVGTSAFQGNSDTTSPGDDVADGASVGAGGSFGVNFGADGAAAVGAISNLTVTAAGGLGPVALTSQGDSVSVVADGANAWKGVADGRDVFTLSFNVTTGNYTFTLLDNLDHPIGDNPATALNESTEDNLVLTFGFRATDGDGDFVDTTITVNVDDDMPIVTGVLPEGTLIVDETTLNLDATLSFAGAFNTLFGADGPGAGTIIESNRIDLYLLQDLSGSFGDDESNVSSAIANLITRIGGDLPTDTQLGAGSFVDKGDYVFQNAVNLTTDYASVQTAVNGFNASGGGDLPESQLEALLFVAQNAASLGFRPDAARTVLIATDAVAHLNGDSGLPANDADGVLENEDYPSVAQLQAALIAANIVPIFAVTADVQAFYDQLVLDLGFGSVVVLTANSSNLVDAIIDGLETTTTIGGGAVDYDLGLSANGVDSGLVHTATNHSVFLFLEGGEIVGREGTDAIDAAGNTIVFVLSVDDAGLVTLDQRAAVRHDPDTGPDQAVSIAAGLITLTGTATDGDGDSASHTLQIGATLVFEDDAPLAVADNAGVIPEDAPFVYNVLANDTQGADGATLVSALLVTGGAGVVTGVLANGNITFDPAPGFAGPVTISYTIRDADGDESVSTLTLQVAPDSVPSVTVVTTDGVVTEAALVPDGSGIDAGAGPDGERFADDHALRHGHDGARRGAGLQRQLGRHPGERNAGAGRVRLAQRQSGRHVELPALRQHDRSH